jgi:hypothetical protein
MLIPRLQALKDELIRLPFNFGVPSYRELAVRKRSPNLKEGIFPYCYDEILSPVPKVVNVNDRQISELISKDSVQISVEDFFVKHVSRVRYDREFLLKDVEFYILDYVNTNDRIFGIKCRPIFLDEAGTTSYSMFLKRLSDHQEIEVAT